MPRADDQIAFNYFLLQIYEQIKIVIPISLYFVLFLAIVFQRAVEGKQIRVFLTHVPFTQSLNSHFLLNNID